MTIIENSSCIFYSTLAKARVPLDDQEYSFVNSVQICIYTLEKKSLLIK